MTFRACVLVTLTGLTKEVVDVLMLRAIETILALDLRTESVKVSLVYEDHFTPQYVLKIKEDESPLYTMVEGVAWVLHGTSS